MDYIEKLKQESNNSDDYIYKEIKLNKNIVNTINIETITSSNDINDFILKRISILNKLNYPNLEEFFLNFLPSPNISKLKDYDELKTKLLNGYTIINY